jgi:hypothetical protein
MQAVQSTSLRASRITHPKHSPLVNPLTFGLRQEFRKEVAEGLAYTTTRYERPFWKLRDTEKIDLELKESRHIKWGFIFYRCTYKDDNAWKRFMEIARQRAELNLEADKGIDIRKRLELTFREDRLSFDAATIDQVRDHFKSWVKQDDPSHRLHTITEEQGDGASPILTSRYVFAIHVDAESLHSVVMEAPSPGKPDNGGIGYVNLVDSLWDPNPPLQCPEDAEFEHDEHEDGDIGYMRVCIDGLHPAVYSLLSDRSNHYVFYKSPPEVLVR